MADLASNDAGPDPGISKVCFGIAGVCGALGSVGLLMGGAVPGARDLSGLLVVAGIYLLHAFMTWPRNAESRTARRTGSDRIANSSQENVERQVA